MGRFLGAWPTENNPLMTRSFSDDFDAKIASTAAGALAMVSGSALTKPAKPPPWGAKTGVLQLRE